MKIGIYNQTITFKSGGTESYTAHLIESIQKIFADSEIHIIADKNVQNKFHTADEVIGRLNSSFGTNINSKNIKIVELRHDKSFYVFSFRFYIVSSKYDLFFNCSVNMLIPNGKKNIFIVHFPDKLYSQTNFGKKNKLFLGIARKIDKKTKSEYSAYFCNSQFTAHWLKKLWNESEEKIKLLYPPVRLVEQKKEKKNIILICSRIERSKCIEPLIETYKNLSTMDYQLVIAGGCTTSDEKQYYNLLVEKTKQMNLKFILNTSRSELEEIFASTKIFWHAKGFNIAEEENPYFLEHFGITTVEAMSAGAVPVVINKGGQKEIVDENINGFKWDTTDELLKKTKSLIENPRLLQKMSENAIEKSQSYSVENFEKHFIDYLKSCIQGEQMNFLYDLTATQPTLDSKFHGGGTYAEIVFLKILETFNSKKINLFAAYDSRRYINSELLETAKRGEVHIIDINKERPNEILKKYQITRFYSALLDEFIPWDFRHCEVISTVHGLRGLEMPLDSIALKYETSLKNRIKDFVKLKILPAYYTRKIYNGYSRFFDGKKKIITVSQHSKASILSFFPNMNAEDIKVFASPNFDTLQQNYIVPVDFSPLAKKYNIEQKKYFLITSSARWIKNAMRVVFAFDSLFDDGKLTDFKIVLTGVNEKSIFEKQIRHKEKFVLAGYVERDELEAFNQNAFAFIYPSLNEGFGYPPLEAMKYGVPVTTSGTSSIPEICGKAALYFDPYNPSEIKNRIIQLIDREIYIEFSKRAKTQYELLSAKQRKDLDGLVKYLTTPPRKPHILFGKNRKLPTILKRPPFHKQPQNKLCVLSAFGRAA